MAKKDKDDDMKLSQKKRIGADEDRWATDNDLRTLKAAEEIKEDPDRVRRVDEHRKEEISRLSRIKVKVEQAPNTIPKLRK